MLDIFSEEMLRLCGAISPRALEFVLEPEGFRHRAGDGKKPTGYRGTYEKTMSGRISRGARLLRIRKTCPFALRVFDHPICRILETSPPPSLDELDALLAQLSSEVQAIVSSNKISLTRRTLARIGTVDALAAILILIQKMKHGECPGAALLYALEARDIFMRVAAFSPFFEVRENLFYYLKEHFYMFRTGYPEPPTFKDVDIVLSNSRTFLEMMMRLGLLGPTLHEQIRFVGYYRRWSTEAIRATRMAHYYGSYTLNEFDPLWKELHRVGHPAGRSRKPATLPWKARRPIGTRIANAFGAAHYSAG